MTRGRDYLGPYRLIRLIRAGQTCQVWEAVHDINKSRVALKALQPEKRADKQEIAYLKHEYAVGKDLDHPNVIGVHEFSIDRQVPFVVLELSHGRNMKLVLREGLDQIHFLAQRIIEESAAGLYYLHQQGWVHRDIKPDNFLVHDDGHTKLIDFAIARKSKTGISKLFNFGNSAIQGTRSYMSPEQIRNKPLDVRADIYSYGCMLYELMCGKAPYTASTPEELLNKHLKASIPSVLTQNSNVTQDFSNLIMRLMAKKPEDRVESMKNVIGMVKSTRIFRQRPKPPAEAAAETEEEN